MPTPARRLIMRSSVSVQDAATGAFGGAATCFRSPTHRRSEPRERSHHFLDTRAYVAAQNQQLGDADIMQTDDLHCAGISLRQRGRCDGMGARYARYGRGLIIYNGFDTTISLTSRPGNGGYTLRIRPACPDRAAM